LLHVNSALCRGQSCDHNQPRCRCACAGPTARANLYACMCHPPIYHAVCTHSNIWQHGDRTAALTNFHWQQCCILTAFAGCSDQGQCFASAWLWHNKPCDAHSSSSKCLHNPTTAMQWYRGHTSQLRANTRHMMWFCRHRLHGTCAYAGLAEDGQWVSFAVALLHLELPC
jgi:hypothetical protein